MPALREIKDRIGSVRSTLKITSAMKLVASSKLRKAQKTIEALRPYEEALSGVISSLMSSVKSPAEPVAAADSSAQTAKSGKVALVAISSNSSLCGGFNSSVIKKAMEVVREQEDVRVFCLGRKMADAMKKSGHPSEKDYNDLIGHPSFDKTAALAEYLADKYESGEYSKVILVYNHFVTTSKQVPVVETYLPFDSGKLLSGTVSAEATEDFILEPSAEEMLESLLPRVMRLKFHAAVLDSAAAEQAARAVAMQTATDNAEDLLGELTLEYNKKRQQKITSEILDLLGGSAR